jgi:hypothetical protein
MFKNFDSTNRLLFSHEKEFENLRVVNRILDQKIT